VRFPNLKENHGTMADNHIYIYQGTTCSLIINYYYSNYYNYYYTNYYYHY